MRKSPLEHKLSVAHPKSRKEHCNGSVGLNQVGHTKDRKHGSHVQHVVHGLVGTAKSVKKPQGHSAQHSSHKNATAKLPQ